MIPCVWLAMAAACSDAGRERAVSTVRDSAGVEIVENERPSWGARDGWRVDADPTVEILGGRGRPLFNVIGVVRVDDGRVVVANQSSSELLLFDAAGRFLHSIGREGDGPGEFRDISHLVYCGGDSITVYDRRTLRASVLTLDGEFAGSFAPPSLVEHGVWPRVIACRPDGATLVVGWGRSPPSEAGPRRSRPIAPVLFLAGVDARPALLGEFPGNEWQVWVDAEGTGWRGAAPFGKRTSIVLGDSSVYVALGDAHEIVEHDRAGSVLRRIRWSASAVPVTREDRSAFEAALLDSLPAERLRLTKSLIRRIEYPEHMPSHGEVMIDRSRHLWVEEYRWRDDDPASWLVFGPRGRLLGAVAMPPDLDVRQIGPDFVLGVAKNGLGVERVRLYHLSR